jgi:hypothetical protein
MTVYHKVGDALRGKRIAVKASRIGRVYVTRGSSQHRIQNSTLSGSAYSVIEKPLRILRADQQ